MSMSPSSKPSVEIHQQFLAIAADLSPLLVEAIAHNGPIDLGPHQTEPFAEHLCRAVTGQQLSIKAASSIWGRVVACVPAEGSLIDFVATADPLVLRGCGLSGAKVKTLGAIAQATTAGQLDTQALSQLSHIERTNRLTALWGIGQWTADMASIFYFGEPDVWPDGDMTARKTLERLTSARRKTVRTAARFAPYRSYLALHMWQYVDAEPA